MKRPLLVALTLLPALTSATAGGAAPSLRLDARPLGLTAEVMAVPAAPKGEGPMFYPPAHIRAVLNVPGTRWMWQDPAEEPPAYVAVYPVAGLKRQYPGREPVSWDGWVRAAVQNLDALRLGKTSVAKLARPLPHLPPYNAFQAVAGAVRPLATKQFSGLRYLTIYSQESGVRFARENVYYTFQGMTRDGRHIVVVRVPYAPRGLPTRAGLDRTKDYLVAPIPTASAGLTSGPYLRVTQQYLADTTRKLDAESDTPGLARLDALVRSVRVN